MFRVSFYIIILILVSCGNQKKVQILIKEMPDLPGAKVFVASERKEYPLKNGTCSIVMDSVKEGVYTFTVIYPGNHNWNYYRNESGKVDSNWIKVSTVNLTKMIYINPQQSRKYIVTPARRINNNMILSYRRGVDVYRSDLFRLKLRSKGEDVQLYENFDSLSTYYRNETLYRILDSLYTNSKVKDKIYVDYREQASDLNKVINYPIYFEELKSLIKKNTGSPISTLQILNLSKDVFLNDPEYIRVVNTLYGRALEKPFFEQVNLKFNLENSDSLLSIGSVFKPPAGVDSNNDPVSLNLSSNNFTLVEFWASWCLPCRVNNPKWNKILYKYKTKGFQILGISLDSYVTPWRAAIAKDELKSWIHISDLQNGFEGTNALQYGLKSIPANVLLDASGRILKKNIEPEALDEFLRHHYGALSVNAINSDRVGE